ncbi:MAG: SpoIID/LytB domain-containing protein, partial [Chloroflexi bacterium]|nr:SpoIID/LytB domain-containing protein [Chloroflexota bacterium]
MVALLILLGARGEAQPRISVGLLRASRPDSVSVSCSTGLMLSAGQDNPAGIAKRILISASGRSVQLASDRLHKKLFPALIVASSGGSAITITVHGVSISYRGVLRLSSRGGHLLITNEVLLEDYVRGVVASEMRSDWPSEVLKAQAVVARTLAVARIRRHRSEGFDICDTTHCQVYRG